MHRPARFTLTDACMLVMASYCTQVVDDWTSCSFRLLALAAGTIKHFSRLNVSSLTLQQAEAAVSHMSLVGVMVVTNQLRPDSRDTIAELQDK